MCRTTYIMKSTHFPSEIWAKIKSYEYQLVHSPKIEKIVHDLIHNAYMPYYLGMHEHKGGDQLFSYASRKKEQWLMYFTEKDMKILCHRLNRKAMLDYD